MVKALSASSPNNVEPDFCIIWEELLSRIKASATTLPNIVVLPDTFKSLEVSKLPVNENEPLIP